MTPKFSAKVSMKLQAFQAYAEGHAFTSCRLVHYIGVDRPNAVDLPLDEVEKQIAGCLAEGFVVDWSHTEGRLYLCVQEPGCPIPPWDKVMAEQALVDVDALLREAGFDDVA
jgi:hypothetical protein